MKLLNFTNFQIQISDEALLVKPFRDLYYLDNTETKEEFLKQMSIIFFLKDPRSNYSYIVNENDRLKEILAQEGLDESYDISIIQDALDIYEKLTTTASQVLLKNARNAVDKISEFLGSVDLYATDDKGKPIYPINTIVGALDKVPKITKALQEAEKAVNSEINEISKARGNAELKIMD